MSLRVSAILLVRLRLWIRQRRKFEYVVASFATYNFDDCVGTICTDYSGSGFMYWPAGNPEAPPGIVQLTCPTICNVYYMDMDNSNDIWFTFMGAKVASADMALPR